MDLVQNHGFEAPIDGEQAWCDLDNRAKGAVLPEMAESKEAVKRVLPGTKDGCF